MNRVSARHPYPVKSEWLWLVKASLLAHLHVQRTIIPLAQIRATNSTLGM